MPLLIAGSDKPLSRKKARQLMPRNHKALTGEQMAMRYGRTPGSGRFKSRVEAHEAELQKQERKEVNEAVKAKISTALTQLRNFLKPRVGAVRPVQAARAS